MNKRYLHFAALGAVSWVLSFVPPASAREITTLYTSGNGLNGPNVAVFFDVGVGPKAIEITGLTTNTDSLTTFTMKVYTRMGTRVGNEGSMSGWTLAATGTGAGKGTNVPSPVALDKIIRLEANTTYGFALEIVQAVDHKYTNGTGSNQIYSNADLKITTGASQTPIFTGGLIDPRVWNGSLIYAVDLWTEYYQKAESEFAAYAALGDTNFAYAFYYFNKALGDYLFHYEHGRNAEAIYWFHIWVGVYHYYYFQIIPRSKLPSFYLFQWYAYAYYYYYFTLGDINSANAKFNEYWSQALGFL